jgi:hypothetical protein
MKTCLRRALVWSVGRVFGLVAAVVLAAGAAHAVAQDIVHVEEDWELVLGGPDATVCGPQVAITMSPTSDISDIFFTLEINHRSAPYWTPGGITMHQWQGEQRIQSLDRADRSIMQTDGETVKWTQVLDVNGGALKFQIKNGSSTTWGPWGITGNFKLVTGWPSGNLNSYTPDVSVSQSGVAYAGNRVKSLSIKSLRITLSDGSQFTDSTGWMVQQLLE